VEQLVKANMDNSKEPLAVCQKLLETLLEGWRGAVQQVNSGQ
jgi:flagellin-specific chaperone FliS